MCPISIQMALCLLRLKGCTDRERLGFRASACIGRSSYTINYECKVNFLRCHQHMRKAELIYAREETSN
jgi:hypothetical protein